MIDFETPIKKKLSRAELAEYKKTLQLTDLQRECIIGTLLGDASIADPLTDTINPTIKWEQSMKYQEYINHIYEIMKPWVGTPPIVRNITGGGARDRQSIWFKTYRHQSFKFYMHEFYMFDRENNGKRRKCIPKLIHRWLTPRVLAYWYMDDGSAPSTINGYLLNTQSFPFEEQKRLCQVLGNLYNLEVAIHKDKDRYRLYINVKSKDKFTELISPYILPCMAYKLRPFNSIS